MGTILSPCRYDAAAGTTPRPPKQRSHAMSCYAVEWRSLDIAGPSWALFRQLPRRLIPGLAFCRFP
jgi:toxin HigB-1